MKGVDLQHPRHGRKTAYTPAELAFDKSHGWAEIAPKPAQEDPTVPNGADPPSDRDEVIAKLKAEGIEYDGRLGLAKLRALLP